MLKSSHQTKKHSTHTKKVGRSDYSLQSSLGCAVASFYKIFCQGYDDGFHLESTVLLVYSDDDQFVWSS